MKYPGIAFSSLSWGQEDGLRGEDVRENSVLGFPFTLCFPHWAGKYPGQSDTPLERLCASGHLVHLHFVSKLSPLPYCICFHDPVLLFAKCNRAHCLCCFSVLEYGCCRNFTTNSYAQYSACGCTCLYVCLPQSWVWFSVSWVHRKMTKLERQAAGYIVFCIYTNFVFYPPPIQI